MPVNATKASSAPVCVLIEYSAVMPGMTKPSVTDFMTSMESATMSTTNSVQCERLSGALSAR